MAVQLEKDKFLAWCKNEGVTDAASNAILEQVGGKPYFVEVVNTCVSEGSSFQTLLVGLVRQASSNGDGFDFRKVMALQKSGQMDASQSPSGDGEKPYIPAVPYRPAMPTVGGKPLVQGVPGRSETPTPGKRPDGKPFPGLGGLFGSKKKPPMGVGPRKPGVKGKSSNKKMIFIGAVVIFVLLAAVVGYFALSSGGPEAQGYNPAGLNTSADPQATEAPRFDENGKEIEWFVVQEEELDTTEPFLTKPATFTDFIKKVPWRWLLWIIFFVPMFSLLAKDRFSSGERTDIGTVIMGLSILFITLILTEPLGIMVTWISHQIGSPIDAPAVWINLVGILVNLGVQWSATTSGKRDYSAFAIAGLFATGALLIWWNPTVLITIIIGAIFMLGGILLQAHEMNRSKQGGRAVFVALIMLVVFAVTMAVWQLFCGGIANFPQPESELGSKVLGFLIWALVSSKTWMSGIVAILVVMGMGDMIASAIMPPRRPSSMQADGYVNQSDRDKRLDIDSRFDAMVFAIMLMYPIAVIVWEAIRVFIVL